MAHVPHPVDTYAGNIFLVVAPSGAGKSSRVNALL
jgi:guanylate kinase